METRWNSQENLMLTTQAAILLFLCTAFTVIGLCMVTILKRRALGKNQTTGKNQGPNGSTQTKWDEPGCDLANVKRMLMDSVRWSGANRLEERPSHSQSPLLGCGLEGGVAWQSHNSTSPVWQRPILMGEKCQFPRFSGVILYDERGRLLHQSIDQEKPETLVPRRTLRELLL